MEKNNYNEKDFKLRIKEELLKDSNRLREKYPPLSDILNGIKIELRIDHIYQLMGDLNYFYVIKVKSKGMKLRYIMCINLASQSSDFLVNIARKIIKGRNNLKLLQFSLIPKHLRVNLLCLKEIEIEDDLQEIVKLLKEVRDTFRTSLEKLTFQMEND